MSLDLHNNISNISSIFLMSEMYLRDSLNRVKGLNFAYIRLLHIKEWTQTSSDLLITQIKIDFNFQ